ncbi:acylneuraminate cytidylyltransferase family protein [Verrucomicrobia bacterium]|nr:acylneuraminate cytidylyltransferase family protein [Verrucomicrobiota bacterium]
MSEVLGMIPARGGSKGVIKKNIRNVGGKPLIYWTISALKLSKYCTEFAVSTDDPEIAEISKKGGANIVFRPQHLAEDETPMIEAIKHFITSYKNKYKYLALLQPTAPMRTADDIDMAIKLFLETKPNSLISVYKVEDAHPARMYSIFGGHLKPIYQEPPGSLRQQLPDIYHRNGAIYICDINYLLSSNRLWDDRPIPFIMPKDRSYNIDDEQDLKIVDILMSK